MNGEIYDKISVNIPRELLTKIDEAAAKDHRTRSSWLIHNLESLMEETKVAETPEGNGLFLSIPADGAPAVKYPAGRTRKKLS